MRKIYDISVSVNRNLPTWPGSIGCNIELISDKSKGDFATNSKLQIDTHYGTHVDAPLHHITGGKTTDEIDINKCVGKCAVLEILNQSIITAEILKKKLELKPELYQKKLLLKTDNSSYFKNQNTHFNSDYAALDKSAAVWIAENDIDLIGIDYYSIQKYNDPPDVHEILLRKEIVILETINLSNISEGLYFLTCAPIKIEGLEGAHCRALLMDL